MADISKLNKRKGKLGNMSIQQNLPFPERQYNVIYADPPWSYSNNATRAAASSHYATMSQEDIAALPVSDIAAQDCVLLLWATYPMLEQALETIKAWGFTFKTMAFTWVKLNPSGKGLFMGLGNWTRCNPELCLLAVRGKPKRASAKVRSVIISPVEQHSKKPDEARCRIEELMGDVPRIELFARTRVSGWDAWGNEVPGEGLCKETSSSVKTGHATSQQNKGA